ncbi:MAG: FAD-binding oxidoreductase [Flavobacteriales bacterium]|nr:FAD-binding oxidoreductase [Flavobacteriales bacterium]MBP6698650.1 FAD-binding oxidoreductase [Flavobacteriales bacterium]
MHSIWEQRSFLARPDLAVVGAGLVGLFAALHAKRLHPGWKVVVLERGPHPSGASVRNAGFACFGSPSELLADIAAEGEATALRRVEERWKGLLELRAELGDAAIGFEPSGGHEIYGVNDPLYNQVAEGFDRLNVLLADITGPGTYRWLPDGPARFGLALTSHIVRTDLEGPVDTGRLMRSLLAKVSEAGVEMHFGQDVQRLENADDGVDLVLANGHTLNARQVLVATNGYARQLLPALDIEPARGQVLLTEPVPGLKLKGTFHANEGYFYFRDYEGRVLLGGGRHLDKAGERTWDDGTTPLIMGSLEDLLRTTILPDQNVAIVHRWSGVMGFRAKGKEPLVARVAPNVLVAAGLSGMGVAIGVRVARRAVGLIVHP